MVDNIFEELVLALWMRAAKTIAIKVNPIELINGFEIPLAFPVKHIPKIITGKAAK